MNLRPLRKENYNGINLSIIPVIDENIKMLYNAASLRRPNSVWDIRVVDETPAGNDAAALARSGAACLRPAVLRYLR